LADAEQYCTASRLSLFLTLPTAPPSHCHRQVGWGRARGWKGSQPGKLSQADLGYPIPYNVMHSIKKAVVDVPA